MHISSIISHMSRHIIFNVIILFSVLIAITACSLVCITVNQLWKLFFSTYGTWQQFVHGHFLLFQIQIKRKQQPSKRRRGFKQCGDDWLDGSSSLASSSLSDVTSWRTFSRSDRRLDAGFLVGRLLGPAIHVTTDVVTMKKAVHV